MARFNWQLANGKTSGCYPDCRFEVHIRPDRSVAWQEQQ
jgi:hypothetical protein